MNDSPITDADRAMWKRHYCVGGKRKSVGKYRPHIGNRQRIRELKRNWKAFEKICTLRPSVMDAKEGLLDAIAKCVAPADEELSCYVAALAATIRSRDTGRDIADCLNDAVADLLATPRVASTWAVPNAT